MHEVIKRVRTVLLAIVGALLVAPAGALAGDPLLSGYGGPGGGEQVVLGSELLPAGKGGSDGSLQAKPAAASQRVAATPQVSSAPSLSGAAKARKQARKRSSTRRGERRRATKRGSAVTSAPAVGSPEVIPYPSRVSAAGSLPLSGADVMAALLGVLALVLVGLGMRRLVARGPAPPGAPSA